MHRLRVYLPFFIYFMFACEVPGEKGSIMTLNAVALVFTYSNLSMQTECDY